VRVEVDHLGDINAFEEFSMTTINRLNTMISDRNMVANVIAIFVLASFSVLSAAAINHSANLVNSTFNTLLQSTSNVETPTTHAQPTKGTSAIVISANGYSDTIQGQSQDLDQLQPADNVVYNSKISTETLQSGINNMQVAGIPQTQ